MKIFVPIDFSAASDWGFYYAYQLARQLDAELIAAHIYQPPYVESTMPEKIVREIVSDRAEERMGHLRANTQPPIGCADDVRIRHILESSAALDIMGLAKREGADLIIMGTHGAEGLVNKFIGTNASSVVADAPCPVITVPVGTEFKGFSSIAYAADFDENDLNNIDQLLTLAKLTGAQVYCVHINVVGEQRKLNLEADFRNRFAERFEGKPVTFSTRSANSVEDGLESFMRLNKVSILAMQPQKRKFFARWFGTGSLTREMVLRAERPILAFHS